MTTESKRHKAVEKLLEKTRSGELDWEVNDGIARSEEHTS